jgi:septum formation protein
MNIVLASTSPYRRRLLEQAGLAFQCVAPLCDENELKDPAMPPRLLAKKLALAKAESLRASYPHAAIIGSDQVIALGRKTFSKPRTAERAEAQLAELAGQTHEVLTAVAIVHASGIQEYIETARMTMRALSKEEIAEYVRADQPLNCAGSYKLESRGAALFEKIECADRTAITGLPILWVKRALNGLERP